jgi:hypothetical protein
MNMLTAILPFAIILIILAFGYSLIKFGKKIFTTKITHWALFSYLVILLVATIVLPFMSDDIKVMGKVDQREEEKVMNEIYENLQMGKLDQIDDLYLAAETTFKHEESQPLRITSANEQGTHVYIEKKPENDDEIDVFVYRPSLFVNEIDFSETLDSYEVTKKENSLHISVPIKNLHLSILSAPFPTRQLTGESIMMQSSSSTEGIVYLRVPSNLQITNSNQVFLNYVE